MDRYEAAFQRAYDRYKAERRSLILACFLVALIDFANFQVNGVSNLGLSGTINWNVVNNWFVPIMLIWFTCMHIQATYHYYGATYPEKFTQQERADRGLGNKPRHLKYLSGIKEAYRIMIYDTLTASSKISTDPNENKTMVSATLDIAMLNLPWHKKIWVHIKALTRLSVRDHRVAADVAPVLVAVVLLLRRIITSTFCGSS